MCSCVWVKKDYFTALGKNSPCFQNSSVCFLVTFSKWRCLQLPHYSQKQLPSVIQSDRTGTGLQCQGAPSRESRRAAKKQTGVLGLSLSCTGALAGYPGAVPSGWPLGRAPESGTFLALPTVFHMPLTFFKSFDLPSANHSYIF